VLGVLLATDSDRGTRTRAPVAPAPNNLIGATDPAPRPASHRPEVSRRTRRGLLADIAAQLKQGFSEDDADGWIARADQLDNDIERAWSVIEGSGEWMAEPATRSAGRVWVVHRATCEPMITVRSPGSPK
jgi:hypothetical protein